MFRLFWKRRSKSSPREPRVSVDVLTLIHQMVREKLLVGAERIRGELKLGLKVAKRTISGVCALRVRHFRRGDRVGIRFCATHRMGLRCAAGCASSTLLLLTRTKPGYPRSDRFQ